MKNDEYVAQIYALSPSNTDLNPISPGINIDLKNDIELVVVNACLSIKRRTIHEWIATKKPLEFRGLLK